MRIYLAILLLALIGCSHRNLVPDTVIPAVQANFPSAEYTACGKLWNGLGACSVVEGESLDSIKLSVQGYFKGAVRIVSKVCQIDDIFRYENSQNIRYKINWNAKESCLLSFVISPEYPNQHTSKVQVHSFKGHLWISVLKKGEQFDAYVSKIQAGQSGGINIPIPSSGARVFIRGCGTNYTTDTELESLWVSTSRLFSRIKVSSCILHGAVKSKDKVTIFVWMIWGYDKTFVPLPKPKLDDSLDIIADGSVTAISLNEKYKMGNEGSFSFNHNGPNIVRVFTVNGRSKVGKWSVGEQEWEWSH